MLSLSTSSISCRSAANAVAPRSARTQVRAPTTLAHPAAHGVRMGAKLQQKHSLAGCKQHMFARACERAVVSRTYAVQVRAEEGEEEMMIEEEAREKFEKTLSSVQSNFDTVRTGRANTSLLDRLEVEYYGAPCNIKTLASISTPDAQTIAIQPFDKASIGDIERAIMKSDVGLQPNSDGNVIRLIIPALTEERRKELAKLVSKLGEDGKVALRNVRRDATKQYQKLEKDGSSSKDMCESYCKEMDEMTNSYVKKIDEIIKKKEAEIMKV